MPPGAITAPERYRPHTLASELARRGHFSPEETLEIGLRLAEAVAYLHSRPESLVHRDIKPENVIRVDKRWKLADPGLVSDRPSERQHPVRHGRLCGPPGLSRHAADVYSLGKTLYTLLTGLPPAQFPRFPTFTGASAAEKRLAPDLNQVVLCATAADETHRYPTAVELRDDLARLHAGQRPLLYRAPRLRRPFAWGPLVGVAAGSAVVLLIFLAGRPELGLMQWLSQSWREWRADTRPRLLELLYSDAFAADRLDPALWSWKYVVTRAEPPYGVATRQVSVANGTLRIENRVFHEEGWNIKQTVWVLSRHDLKLAGETWLAVELSGRAANAHFRVAPAAADGPWSQPSELITLYERGGGRFQPAQGERTRFEIKLSPASGLAWVRWNEPEGPRQRLVDAAGLAAWYLVFHTAADSAAGMDAGEVELVVHHASAHRARLPRRLAGWVTLAQTSLPVIGLEVFNRRLLLGGITGAEGAFVLPAASGWNELAPQSPHYRPATPLRPARAARTGLTRFSFEVTKTRTGRGDVGAAHPLPRRPLNRLALGPAHWYALSDGGLWQFDPDSGLETLLGPLRPDIGLCWAEGRLFAVGTHHEARLFEVSTEASPVARPRFELPTLWPVGLGWDGTNFWFAEYNTQHTNRFGVYAVDAATGTVRIHLPTSDTQLRDVAWGAGRLWVTSAAAGLYEVDPDKALHGGTLEAGIVTNYPGLCGDIEFADAHLWLLCPDRLLQIRVDAPPAEPPSAPQAR